MSDNLLDKARASALHATRMVEITEKILSLPYIFPVKAAMIAAANTASYSDAMKDILKDSVEVVLTRSQQQKLFDGLCGKGESE